MKRKTLQKTVIKISIKNLKDMKIIIVNKKVIILLDILFEVCDLNSIFENREVVAILDKSIVIDIRKHRRLHP